MGGPHGPYRQSERREIYQEQVDRLVAAGKAYPCFCTDAELAAMKADAERRNLPPVYRGKWARASAEDVQAEVDKVAPPLPRVGGPDRYQGAALPRQTGDPALHSKGCMNAGGTCSVLHA